MGGWWSLAPGYGSRRTPLSAVVLSGLRILAFSQREPEDEGGANPRLRGHGQAAAQVVHQLADGGESQTRATAMPLGGEEGTEELGLYLGGRAFA